MRLKEVGDFDNRWVDEKLKLVENFPK